jgi:hypothetical protein
MILGGIVASIYGLERHAHKDAEAPTESLENDFSSREGKCGLGKICQMLLFGVPKEKPSLWKRLRSKFSDKR